MDKTGEIKIIALGDSITNAVGISGVEEQDTYRYLMQAELSKAMARKVTVINAGVNGDITTLALGRLEQDVLRHKPHYVTIMFGVNDAGYFRPDGPVGETPRVSAKEFEENLRFIISQVKSVDAKPILVTPAPMSPSYHLVDLPAYVEHGLNYLVDEYADIIRRLAPELKIPLIDVHRVFSADESTQEYVPDGIHPDKRGQRLIADIFVKAFIERIFH